jgi:GNAT superfamily N-acetyltransferase
MTELLRLKDEDLEKAYSIICWRVDYLQSKGIMQYVAPYPPFEVFKERQDKGQNFGLYAFGKLTVIVSLIRAFPEEWRDISSEDNCLWICSLFTSNVSKGQNLGRVMLEKIEDYAQSISIESLILDCFINDNEFLIKYYKETGFEEILRKEVVYPNRKFMAAFMKKKLIRTWN